MANWGSVKTSSYGDSFSMTDHAAVLDLKEAAKNKWFRLRCMPGGLLPTRQLWFATKSAKDGQVKNWPRLVESFDPKTEEYVKLPKGQRDHYKDFAEANGQSPSVSFWVNVLNRQKQENRPAKARLEPTPAELKTGFKDISSKTFTPVEVTFFNSQLAKQIQRLMEGNMRTNKKGERKVYPPDDPVYGFDIEVYFDAKTKDPNKWSVRIPDEDSDGGKGKVRLTPEEVDYLTWDLEGIYAAQLDAQRSRSALEDIAASLSRFVFTDRKTNQTVKTVVPDWLKEAVGSKASKYEDEDEDDAPRSRKSKGVKGGKKKPPVDDDEDEDEEDVFGDEDLDDDDDAPPPSRAKSKGGKKPPVDEDEDEDEDYGFGEDDEDEDEDDDAPRKRPSAARRSAKAAKPKGGKKKPPVDDDEDEDEADTPPRRSAGKGGMARPKTKPKAKKFGRGGDIDDDEIPF